jgi:hypothetical protein
MAVSALHKSSPLNRYRMGNECRTHDSVILIRQDTGKKIKMSPGERWRSAVDLSAQFSFREISTSLNQQLTQVNSAWSRHPNSDILPHMATAQRARPARNLSTANIPRRTPARKTTFDGTNPPMVHAPVKTTTNGRRRDEMFSSERHASGRNHRKVSDLRRRPLISIV